MDAQTPTGSIQYLYDADGIRVGSTVDGVLTSYLVDKNWDFAQVMEERDGGNSLVVSYVCGDDLISHERGGADSYYHYMGWGAPITSPMRPSPLLIFTLLSTILLVTTQLSSRITFGRRRRPATQALHADAASPTTTWDGRPGAPCPWECPRSSPATPTATP